MSKMVCQFSGKAADRKEFRYAGRNLHAGDEFETTSEKDTKVLMALGFAVPADSGRKGVSRPPSVYDTRHMAADRGGSVALDEPKEEIADLRDRYEAIVGRRPFNGWDADTLREKIAAVQD